jgi:hypothetical protein
MKDQYANVLSIKTLVGKIDNMTISHKNLLGKM